MEEEEKMALVGSFSSTVKYLRKFVNRSIHKPYSLGAGTQAHSIHPPARVLSALVLLKTIFR